jgi:hypothetical protein
VGIWLDSPCVVMTIGTVPQPANTLNAVAAIIHILMLTIFGSVQNESAQIQNSCLDLRNQKRSRPRRTFCRSTAGSKN